MVVGNTAAEAELMVMQGVYYNFNNDDDEPTVALIAPVSSSDYAADLDDTAAGAASSPSSEEAGKDVWAAAAAGVVPLPGPPDSPSPPRTATRAVLGRYSCLDAAAELGRVVGAAAAAASAAAAAAAAAAAHHQVAAAAAAAAAAEASFSDSDECGWAQENASSAEEDDGSWDSEDHRWDDGSSDGTSSDEDEPPREEFDAARAAAAFEAHAAIIWAMGERELHATFERTFGRSIGSKSNVWLRQQLLAAMGGAAIGIVDTPRRLLIAAGEGDVGSDSSDVDGPRAASTSAQQPQYHLLKKKKKKKKASSQRALDEAVMRTRVGREVHAAHKLSPELEEATRKRKAPPLARLPAVVNALRSSEGERVKRAAAELLVAGGGSIDEDDGVDVRREQDGSLTFKRSRGRPRKYPRPEDLPALARYLRDNEPSVLLGGDATDVTSLSIEQLVQMLPHELIAAPPKRARGANSAAARAKKKKSNSTKKKAGPGGKNTKALAACT